MIIDDISPPGAWKDELKAAPWGYGQPVDHKVRDALAEICQRGMWVQADILRLRIVQLEAEIERMVK